MDIIDVIVIVCVCVLAGVLIGYELNEIKTDQQWTEMIDEALKECIVAEEYDGTFIGRKHCTTHNATWDEGGPCPQRGTTPWTPPPKSEGEEV